MNIFEELTQPQNEQSRERLIEGVVTARVTKILEDGTFELNYLSFGDDEPSAPARCMTPMAGKGRGIHFVPEVNDEVIVAFERGNPNLPVILGSVWNEEDSPPEQAKPSPKNNIRTIVTRAGHELTFDDSPGAGRIILRTRNGVVIELDDEGGGSLLLKAPREISLESGAISLQAGSIRLTTGSIAGSSVLIDGRPFSAHIHTGGTIPPLATTGPVSPI